jgi:hypothetical protein
MSESGWKSNRSQTPQFSLGSAMDSMVNFFGHSVVAAVKDPDPRFILGAMLPDFSSMLRATPPRVRCARTRAGVEFHHETDRVFHGSRWFLDFQRAARQQVFALGMRRGPGLAVAHVGVELILDGHLASQSSRLVYLAALRTAAVLFSDRQLQWQEPHVAERFTSLLPWLVERSPNVVPKHPGDVAPRLERILAGRPRLALWAGERKWVNEWAQASWPAIGDASAAWRDHLLHQLL